MSERVYPPVIATARTAFALLGLRFTVIGAEHIPPTGGAVLASNHVSYIDFLCVGLAARPVKRLVRFMAKQEIFAHRVGGPLMRGMHHISVDRSSGAGSYAEALRVLRRGELIGLFPEATISRSFQIKELKDGAARMAAGARVPLIPVVVWGSQRVWTKGRKPRRFPRGLQIVISVGEPLHPRRGDGTDPTALLAERLRAMLAQVQADYPQRPRSPEDSWWLPAAMGGTAPTLEQAAAMDAVRPV